MGTKNQYRITLNIDGRDCGVWDKKTGGDADSSETKYKPGGMAPEETFGGDVEVSNVMLTRVKKRQGRDDIDLIKFLFSRRGRGRATIVEQPLDVDKNAYGVPTTYTGILKKVSGADVDSNSNEADTYELEISTNGSIA